jgi:hypothetical protein
MKTIFVFLVALFFTFIIGCQENSITEPVMNDIGAEFTLTTPTIDKDIVNYYPGSIKLEGMIYDPSHRLNSYAEIMGMVRYRLQPVTLVPKQKAIKVGFYVNAELKSNCPHQHCPWKVINTVEEVLYASSAIQSVFFLEKSFRVRNTCCAPLDLVLKFQIEGKAVTLVSMSLKKVSDKVPYVD